MAFNDLVGGAECAPTSALADMVAGVTDYGPGADAAMAAATVAGDPQAGKYLPPGAAPHHQVVSHHGGHGATDPGFYAGGGGEEMAMRAAHEEAILHSQLRSFLHDGGSVQGVGPDGNMIGTAQARPTVRVVAWETCP